jgi:hypothetical protein
VQNHLSDRVEQARVATKRRAVIMVAWGNKYVLEAVEAVRRSPGLVDLDVFVMTDSSTDIPVEAGIKFLRVKFAMSGYARKAEFYKFLPQDYQSFLYLDTDVTVLGDVSLGFEKAESHGMALAAANEYSLSDFKDCSTLMEDEGIEPKGQIQYNSGVIFFDTSPEAIKVLSKWEELCKRWLMGPRGKLLDQPFLSLALEMTSIHPYCLARNYNFRPRREPVVGEVRIWHSWKPCPDDINACLDWRHYNDELARFVKIRKKRKRLGFRFLRWAV